MLSVHSVTYLSGSDTLAPSPRFAGEEPKPWGVAQTPTPIRFADRPSPQGGGEEAPCPPAEQRSYRGVEKLDSPPPPCGEVGPQVRVGVLALA
ncbi:hypothetical protein MesoLj113a_32830 [Mesorhizobium sp. 113-1-2]|nr:hypothetical protein MesoLj113a_32830 [Mesorhizobium sp. 113-1-2]